MTQLPQALAARGYVAITVSYRLTGVAKFPVAIQDAKAAVRWLRAHASVYGIDPDAIWSGPRKVHQFPDRSQSG